MNSNNVGQNRQGGEVRATPAAPQRAPGTQPLKPPPATPAAAKPQAEKDKLATSAEARGKAEEAQQQYGKLLASAGAERENKSMDDAFSRFQAKMSADNAAKKHHEKSTSEGKGTQSLASPGGTNQATGTGGAVPINRVEKVLDIKEEELEKPEDGEQMPDTVEMASDANKTSERAKVDQLAEEQRKAYEETAKLIAGDAEARGGLQSLLLSERLPGEDLDAEGHDLLWNLHAMTAMPLPMEIERKKLMADLVADIAYPDALAKDGEDAPPMVRLVIAMAATRPAEYARLIRGLASLEGSVLLANGRTLKRRIVPVGVEGRWTALLLREAIEGYAESET